MSVELEGNTLCSSRTGALLSQGMRPGYQDHAVYDCRQRIVILYALDGRLVSPQYLSIGASAHALVRMILTVRREIAAPAFLVKCPLTGSGCREPVKGRIRVSKESSMLNSR